jgi:hypothetical protein
MKRLICLFIVVLLVGLSVNIPTKIVKSQVRKNKGTITGFVYARDLGKGKSSLLIDVQNQCPNNEPCQEQPIDVVTVSIDDKRLGENELKTGNKLGIQTNQLDLTKPEVKKTMEGLQQIFNNPQDWSNSQFWVRPNNGGIEEFNDFATGWNGKWNTNQETIKNKSTFSYTDSNAETSEYGFHTRIDYNVPIDYLLKEKIDLSVNYQGVKIYSDGFVPQLLPQHDLLSDKTGGCLNPPPAFYPGKDTFSSIYLPELVQTYKNNYLSPTFKGDFSTLRTPIGYAAYSEDKNSGERRWIPKPKLENQIETKLYQYLKAYLPQTAKPRDVIRLIGITAYGEVFSFTELNNTLILPDGSFNNCRPGINGTAKYVFQGRRLCLCGCFVEDDILDLRENLTVFTLDGKRIVPVTLSPTTATFYISEEVAPGLHKIGYTHPDDDRFVQELDFRVLKLVGKIDQNALIRLQTTNMTLGIVGTEEKLPMRISYAPLFGSLFGFDDVIRIQGGNYQVAITSGGANNTIERDVTGIRVGTFVINYEVDEAPCPCLADYYPRVSE